MTTNNPSFWFGRIRGINPLWDSYLTHYEERLEELMRSHKDKEINASKRQPKTKKTKT